MRMALSRALRYTRTPHTFHTEIHSQQFNVDLGREFAPSAFIVRHCFGRAKPHECCLSFHLNVSFIWLLVYSFCFAVLSFLVSLLLHRPEWFELWLFHCFSLSSLWLSPLFPLVLLLPMLCEPYKLASKTRNKSSAFFNFGQPKLFRPSMTTWSYFS